MTAEVLVITGAAQSGKTQRVLARYTAALGDKRPNSTLWLAPTWRASTAVLGLLMRQGLGACFSPGVMTFDRLASNVAHSASILIRPMDRLRRRRLVRQLIRQSLADGRIRAYRSLAEMGGLTNLICEAIATLKRREIWPGRFRQIAEAEGMSDRDAEFLGIYDTYQAYLAAHDLYDAEGCFWVAKQTILEGRWAPLERLRLVVADGFAEFTAGEHEILNRLAGTCQTLCITLPLEEGADRPELFAGSQATLQELRSRHPHLVHEQIACGATPTWPAMAHLGRTLFGNPRRFEPAADTDGLEIVAASRALGEIEAVGSRIRRLLTHGCKRSGGRPVRPSDVMVVFRSVNEVAPLVREVFGKLGIPVAIEASETLERVPALAALVAMLRLDAEDWPFRKLLGVLASNYFQPDWPEWDGGRSLLAVERIVRRLQVPRGRALLLKQLRDQASPTSQEPSGEHADNDFCTQAQTTLTVLTRLAESLDAMPRRATLRQWSAAWQGLADEVGLSKTMGQSTTAEPEAWDALMKALRVDDLVFGGAEPSPELDRAEALTSLVDVLHHVTFRRNTAEWGRVRVLSAPSVRGLSVPYLFVAGLAEKSFPQPHRRDVLEELAEKGAGVADSQAEHAREEMFLFYEVVTRATRQLTLSYPAMDDAAQPLTASAYLDEVEQACGPGAIVRTELPDLTPIPRDGEPLTAADYRVKAMANAMADDGRLLAALVQHESLPGLAESMLAGIRMTRQRQDSSQFGPSEGMLFGPAAHEFCARTFGAGRIYSATELEQYVYCPFRFLVERVMHLEPLEDLGLEVDYLARGRMVHEALAAFHQRVNQQCGGPTSPASLSPEEYERIAEETLESVLQRYEEGSLEAAMQEIDRRLWKRWIGEYRHQHESYDALWSDCDRPPVPTAFEVSFGRRHGGEALSTERPLEIQIDGQTTRIAGRIDRIDVGEVGGRAIFNIIDCKTGSSARFSADAVASGKLLQLPLYAMAVEELLLADRQATAWQAGYWEIQGAGFKARQALRMHAYVEGRLRPEPEWEQLRTTVARTIGALLASMREGRFPVFSMDEHCTRRCPMKTICRINQVRSLEKQWQALPEQD